MEIVTLSPPAPAPEPVAYRVSCANGEWFYQTEKPTAFNPAHVHPLYASPSPDLVGVSREEIDAIILRQVDEDDIKSVTRFFQKADVYGDRAAVADAILSRLSNRGLEGIEGRP
jgi:hypothetical protein